MREKRAVSEGKQGLGAVEKTGKSKEHMAE